MRSIIVCRWDGQSLSEEAEWLDINEIKFMKSGSTSKERHFKIYQTDKGVFRDCFSIDKTAVLLAKETGFFKADRGVVVNLNDLPDYDSKKDLLLYNEQESIPVATKYKKTIKEFLKNLIKEIYLKKK
jgi:hypothetical protein